MTIWDLFAAGRRRWYVLLLGLVCTAVAAFAVLEHAGVYFTRVQVVFLLAASANSPNALVMDRSDAVILAGVVARRINGSDAAPKLSSPDANIVGRGVTNGYTVQLPDFGGQWSTSFGRAALDVQVVAPDAGTARDRLLGLLDRIQIELRDLQAGQGVPIDRMVTANSVPAAPVVVFMGGAPKYALAMTLAIGLALTIAAAALLDSHRRRPPPPGVEAAPYPTTIRFPAADGVVAPDSASRVGPRDLEPAGSAHQGVMPRIVRPGLGRHRLDDRPG